MRIGSSRPAVAVLACGALLAAMPFAMHAGSSSGGLVLVPSYAHAAPLKDDKGGLRAAEKKGRHGGKAEDHRRGGGKDDGSRGRGADDTGPDDRGNHSGPHG